MRQDIDDIVQSIDKLALRYNLDELAYQTGFASSSGLIYHLKKHKINYAKLRRELLKKEILADRKSTLDQIAAKFNIHRSTVANILREAGLKNKHGGNRFRR